MRTIFATPQGGSANTRFQIPDDSFNKLARRIGKLVLAGLEHGEPAITCQGVEAEPLETGALALRAKMLPSNLMGEVIVPQGQWQE